MKAARTSLNTPHRALCAAACGLMALLLVAGPALAKDEEGWSDVAELSAVFTDGNSESASFGFKNTLKNLWDRNTFTLRAGGIRVESETTGRRAVCSTGGLNAANACTGLVTILDPETETTAENYYINSRFARTVTERFFWYLGANWDRNEFAGVKNRYIGEAGVGNIWFDTDDVKFSTAYGVTFTDQEDVVEIPGIDDTFAGYRFSWDYLNKLGGNTTYTNVLTLDGNVDEGSDWRADMDNGLAVAMNSKLALKLGLRLLYDNEPSFENLTLLNPGLSAIGGATPLTNRLDEMDTIFTAGLVINFK